MKTAAMTMLVTLAILGTRAARAGEIEGPAAPSHRTITLKEAQEMASRHNPSLKNVDEMVYQADMMIYSAWAMLLPTVRANGSVIRNQREIALEFPDNSVPPDARGAPQMSETVMQEKWGKSFGFSANMSIFNPRSIPLIKNAHDSADRTRLTAQRQKNDLLFAVTSSYYQVHSTGEMIGVAEENLKLSEEFKRQSEARLRAGQTTNIDILRAEIQVIDAHKAVENAKDGHKLAKTALTYLIGVEEAFSIAGPEHVSPAEEDLEGLIERAQADRVELAEAEIARKMSERSKTETWMKWLPAFDVTYDWSWSSAAGFSDEKDTWKVIFGASWSLFEGGGRIAELKSRESEIRMAANTADQLSLDIQREVEESYLAVNKRRRNVELADKQLALAEQNQSLISRQYEVGLATSLDVLDASTELANKRISRVLERLQYDISLLSLRKAIGEYHSLSI